MSYSAIGYQVTAVVSASHWISKLLRIISLLLLTFILLANKHSYILFLNYTTETTSLTSTPISVHKTLLSYTLQHQSMCYLYMVHIGNYLLH